MIVKILGCRTPQRYAVHRALQAAIQELHREFSHFNVQVMEVNRYQEIEGYTSILIFPSLVINEKLVCAGRIPSKNEVIAWLREEVAENG